MFNYKNEKYNQFLQGVENAYISKGFSKAYSNAKAYQLKNSFNEYSSSPYDDGFNLGKRSY